MGDGDAGVGGSGDSGCDAGNDDERDARGTAGLGFFAATAEDERITALQADNGLPGPRIGDERLDDAGLGRLGLAAPLANVVDGDILAGEGEGRAGGECVDVDDVSSCDGVTSGEGEKAGISWAGADEEDGAGSHSVGIAEVGLEEVGDSGREVRLPPERFGWTMEKAVDERAGQGVEGGGIEVGIGSGEASSFATARSLDVLAQAAEGGSAIGGDIGEASIDCGLEAGGAAQAQCFFARRAGANDARDRDDGDATVFGASEVAGSTEVDEEAADGGQFGGRIDGIGRSSKAAHSHVDGGSCGDAEQGDPGRPGLVEPGRFRWTARSNNDAGEAEGGAPGGNKTAHATGAEDEEAATSFDATEVEGAVEEAAGVGIELFVATEFAGCADGDAGEKLKITAGAGECIADLAHDLVFSEFGGMEAGRHFGEMLESCPAMEAAGSVAATGADAVVLKPLAAVDGSAISTVNGSEVADDAHRPWRKGSCLPETGGEGIEGIEGGNGHAAPAKR